MSHLCLHCPPLGIFCATSALSPVRLCPIRLPPGRFLPPALHALLLAWLLCLQPVPSRPAPFSSFHSSHQLRGRGSRVTSRRNQALYLFQTCLFFLIQKDSPQFVSFCEVSAWPLLHLLLPTTVALPHIWALSVPLSF